MTGRDGEVETEGRMETQGASGLWTDQLGGQKTIPRSWQICGLQTRTQEAGC